MLRLPLSRAITIDGTECTPKGDVVIHTTTTSDGCWNYHKNMLIGYTSKLNGQPSASLKYNLGF